MANENLTGVLQTANLALGLYGGIQDYEARKYETDFRKEANDLNAGLTYYSNQHSNLSKTYDSINGFG